MKFVSRESQHCNSRETKFTLPQGTSHLVICYIAKKGSNRWKTNNHFIGNSGQHFEGNSELLLNPFALIVFEILPAHGIWRSTVLLLDVI